MLTRELEETLSYAVDEAVKYKHEYVTLEHLLFALLEDNSARDILFNCGAQIEEIAKFLEISSATVKRDWQKARAFLLQTLQQDGNPA